MLASFEAQCRLEFNNATAMTLKVIWALKPKLTINSLNSPTPNSPATPLDIAASISQNPFIKMEFFQNLRKSKSSLL